MCPPPEFYYFEHHRVGYEVHCPHSKTWAGFPPSCKLSTCKDMDRSCECPEHHKKIICSLTKFFPDVKFFDNLDTGDATLEYKSSLFQRHPDACDITLVPVPVLHVYHTCISLFKHQPFISYKDDWNALYNRTWLFARLNLLAFGLLVQQP